MITMGLFVVVYLGVFAGGVRMVAKTIKAGPDAFLATDKDEDSSSASLSFAADAAAAEGEVE